MFGADNGNPKGSRRTRRQVVGIWIVSAALAILVIAAFLPSPYVIEQPGPSFNTTGKVQLTQNAAPSPVITITGAQTYPTTGHLNMTTVSVLGTPDGTPSWLRVMQAFVDPTQNIIPKSVMFPPGTTTKEENTANEQAMASSQELAVAAALSELGIRYSTTLTVAGFSQGSKATDALRKGDIIEQVNGTDAKAVSTLQHAAERAGAGHSVNLRIRRAGTTLNVSVPVVELSDGTTHVARLGVLLNQSFKFPMTVKISLGDVGGPSAGTMFSLGIIDKLTPGSLTGGKFIAGTGTIDADGEVGPIGGIAQKLVGAHRQGAKFFLAPASNCADVVGHIPSGLHVVKVATLAQARSAVATIASTGSTSGLAQCTK